MVRGVIQPVGYREIGYNSRRQFCWILFCIKGFYSNKLFQISHDCEAENAWLRIKLVKLVSENYQRNLLFKYLICDQKKGRDETLRKNLILKGYLYKTITSQNVSSEAQIKKFFYFLRFFLVFLFRSQDIQCFVF